MFLSLTGMAVLHRLHGDDRAAGVAATEALELHVAGGPRRFRNRVDPQNDMLAGAAACCSVLGVLAATAGDAENAARLLGHAERLRTDADEPVPPFQRDDTDRARHAAETILGSAAFAAATERGRRGELGAEVALTL
jgi:hypothetical protein